MNVIIFVFAYCHIPSSEIERSIKCNETSFSCARAKYVYIQFSEQLTYQISALFINCDMLRAYIHSRLSCIRLRSTLFASQRNLQNHRLFSHDVQVHLEEIPHVYMRERFKVSSENVYNLSPPAPRKNLVS
jgi:hypothetical protein